MKHSIGSFIICSLLLFSCRDTTPRQDEEVGASKQAHSAAGYVGGFAHPGASVLFVVEATYQGNYTLEIRYATTNGQTGTASLYINQIKTTAQLQLPDQHTDDSWQSIDTTIDLIKGTNVIVIQHDATDNGLFYLDYIQIKR